MSLTFTSNADKVMPEFVAEASKWLKEAIEKSFGELGQKLIESAAMVLAQAPDGGRIASGNHIRGLRTQAKLIGFDLYGLYLYSIAEAKNGFLYDYVILKGARYSKKMPPPPIIELWILEKQKRGIFSGVENTKSLSYAIASKIRKRGHHEYLPYDYVGLTVQKDQDMIIAHFKELESGR